MVYVPDLAVMPGRLCGDPGVLSDDGHGRSFDAVSMPRCYVIEE
jgi:hypothetical protein